MFTYVLAHPDMVVIHLCSGPPEHFRLASSLDVTPLSLGIKTEGDIMDVIIPRNTTIPTREEVTFTTTKDYFTTISIVVYEGERSKATSNNLLGVFKLCIPPAPKDVPNIKVCFEIDGDGVLNVSAEEETSGLKNKITIDGKGRLSKQEIERMLRDAEMYKAEDEEHVKKIKAMNAFEQYAYEMRSFIRGSKVNSKLLASKMKKMEDAINQAIVWLDNNRFATLYEFEEKMKALKNICNSTISRER